VPLNKAVIQDKSFNLFRRIKDKNTQVEEMFNASVGWSVS
jgi:hypothetical protein